MLMFMLIQTVIMDCCHSGSGTRSNPKDLQARRANYNGVIPGDLDEDLMTVGVRGFSVHDRFRHAGCRSHVLLAACAPYETAYEDTHSGVFTRGLLNALEEVDISQTTNVGLLQQLANLPRSVSLNSFKPGLFDQSQVDKRPNVKGTTGPGFFSMEN
jgi:hypothetical protein